MNDNNGEHEVGVKCATYGVIRFHGEFKNSMRVGLSMPIVA